MLETRCVRRNAARVAAKKAGVKLRDLWGRQSKAVYRPEPRKPGKVYPFASKRQMSRYADHSTKEGN